MRKVTATLTFLFIFAAFLSAAESAKSLFQKGVKAEARQDYEAAFEFYKAVYQQKPEELKYRVPFERTRLLASASKIKRGQKLRDQGNLPEALALFQQAIEVDPSNDLAAQEIRRTINGHLSERKRPATWAVIGWRASDQGAGPGSSRARRKPGERTLRTPDHALRRTR